MIPIQIYNIELLKPENIFNEIPESSLVSNGPTSKMTSNMSEARSLATIDITQLWLIAGLYRVSIINQSVFISATFSRT